MLFIGFIYEIMYCEMIFILVKLNVSFWVLMFNIIENWLRSNLESQMIWNLMKQQQKNREISFGSCIKAIKNIRQMIYISSYIVSHKKIWEREGLMVWKKTVFTQPQINDGSVFVDRNDRKLYLVTIVSQLPF